MPIGFDFHSVTHLQAFLIALISTKLFKFAFVSSYSILLLDEQKISLCLFSPKFWINRHTAKKYYCYRKTPLSFLRLWQIVTTCVSSCTISTLGFSFIIFQCHLLNWWVVNKNFWTSGISIISFKFTFL